MCSIELKIKIFSARYKLLKARAAAGFTGRTRGVGVQGGTSESRVKSREKITLLARPPEKYEL